MKIKLNHFQRIREGSLVIRRIKYNLYFYAIGLLMFIGDLWSKLLAYTKYVDEKSEGWLFRVFFYDAPDYKIYPIIKALDIISFMGFILVSFYAVLWVYSDTYCKQEQDVKVRGFKFQLLLAVTFNLIVYYILRTLFNNYG